DGLQIRHERIPAEQLEALAAVATIAATTAILHRGVAVATDLATTETVRSHRCLQPTTTVRCKCPPPTALVRRHLLPTLVATDLGSANRHRGLGRSLELIATTQGNLAKRGALGSLLLFALPKRCTVCSQTAPCSLSAS